MTESSEKPPGSLEGEGVASLIGARQLYESGGSSFLTQKIGTVAGQPRSRGVLPGHFLFVHAGHRGQGPRLLSLFHACP